MFSVVDCKGKRYEFNSDIDFSEKYGTQIPYGLSSCVEECGQDKIVLSFDHEYNPQSEAIETVVTWNIG